MATPVNTFVGSMSVTASVGDGTPAINRSSVRRKSFSVSADRGQAGQGNHPPQERCAFALGSCQRNRPARIRKEILHKSAASRSSPVRTISDQLPACRSRLWLAITLLSTPRTFAKGRNSELHVATRHRAPFARLALGGAAARPRSCRGLAFVVLLGAACTGTIGPEGRRGPEPVGGGGTGVHSGRKDVGPGQVGGTSGSSQGGAHVGNRTSRRHVGTGGTAPPVILSKGGVMLRLLTQAEYLASVQSLLGTLTTQLTLPDDVSVAGFVSVGASQMR